MTVMTNPDFMKTMMNFGNPEMMDAMMQMMNPQLMMTMMTSMLEPISGSAKMIFMQSMMAANPFSMRDMMSMLVAKKRGL